MNIKLVGALNQHLRDLGLKPGMEFREVIHAPGHPKGTVLISFIHHDIESDQDYERFEPVQEYYYKEVSKWPRITFNRSILKFRKQLKTA